MLDSVTKKRIDNLRNILVGKIPSPQSQVEQITTGLIYKFMYDMDNEAIEMGGVPSFFIDEYEKYSWKHLFDPKLLGVEKVKLYSDAIENLYNNRHAPSIFREIFKNSFLPFKDPSTLNMFLKEINTFHYSNSEQLGNAYEYLLSFMGSQGDAGQFRTPRHIINFIIEIVNPKKNETILDPACGTSGFLISAYKHILTKNTQTRIGDQLNAKERKRIGENLVGYDIDPAMSRISLVNMYLHNFSRPNISEYDTISSEDKWNEYFDIILANPPFFSPSGGIKPHSRFGIKSNRAEVLFIDYIREHLKPKGRAGIIVPEGIIFQTGNAYKTLRKKLIEDSLIGVISLPGGVFQPYSGVKTSILILDKELNQKSENIFFAKVENDGFNLGAKRTPIAKNDLPDVIQLISERDLNDERYIEVAKKTVLDNSDISFSFSNYLEIFTNKKTDFDLVKLGDLVEIQSGARERGGAKTSGIPSIGGGQIDSNGKIKSEKMVYVSEDFFEELNKGKLEHGDVLIVKDGATTGKIGLFQREYEKASINEHVFLLRCNQKIISKFLFYILKNPTFKTILAPYIQGIIGGINLSIKEIEIPLPPIEDQKVIVNELENYQHVIDGSEKIFKNYKPTFEIDSSWEMIELGKVATLKYGLGGESAAEEGSHRFIRITDINEFGLLRSDDKKYASIDSSKEEYILKKHDILIARTGATYGKCLYFEDNEPSIFAGYLIKVSLNEQFIPKFFWIFAQSNNFEIQKKRLVIGGGQPQFNANTLKKLLVPVPPIDQQKKIIDEVEKQQKIVKGNITLMNIFQDKITNKVNKIWGK